MSMRRNVMIVAGEASGDQHAANLATALRQHMPNIDIRGMGGAAMAKAGVDIIIDSTALAVVGIVEILAHYGDIRRAFHRLIAEMDERRPDLLILVDYVEFNLRLGREAKKRGVKVLFYVSPQIWAWRPGRISRIARAVDMMAVIFPFEEEIYRRRGIPVRYVGNPLVDTVHAGKSRDETRLSFGLDPQRPVLGLLPGSRRGELKRHLPLIVTACGLVKARHPEVQFLMPVAPGIDTGRDIYPHLVQELGIRTVPGSYDAMNAADALIAASGTVTLEAGLLGIPMVVIYRIAPLSYALLKPLLRIPDVGLVNIVAGKRIVPELIQHEATPEAISTEAIALLTDTAYARRIRDDLSAMRDRLGEGNGIDNVARVAREMLDGIEPKIDF